ncbi:hypothetical protein [Methylobacterium sp. D54C]
MLDRIDDLDDEDELLALLNDHHRRPALPPEVYVRLLRRCRVDPNRKVEHATVKALVAAVIRWVGWKYRGLCHHDREDMAQSLLQIVTREIAKRVEIDWWEITFQTNLERAAADLYPGLFDLRPDAEKVAIDDHADAINDEASLARDTVDKVLIDGRIAGILTPDEMAVFHPLFMTEIPLRSDRAAIDLVRMLGKPEGTLREMKTAIKTKLEAALTKEEL